MTCKLVKEFVVYALRNFEPVKGFEMRSNVMEFWSFCDSTSSRVENELGTQPIFDGCNHQS